MVELGDGLLMAAAPGGDLPEAHPADVADELLREPLLPSSAMTEWCRPANRLSRLLPLACASRCRCFIPTCRQCEYVASRAADWLALAVDLHPRTEDERRQGLLGLWSVLRLTPELARWDADAGAWVDVEPPTDWLPPDDWNLSPWALDPRGGVSAEDAADIETALAQGASVLRGERGAGRRLHRR